MGRQSESASGGTIRIREVIEARLAGLKAPRYINIENALDRW